MHELLTEFRKFVDLIEGRAMACDGPVTPFLEELNAASDADKARFTEILRKLYAHPPKPEATEGGAHEKDVEIARLRAIANDLQKHYIIATEAHGKGWQPMDTAPKGLPSEDVGCRYESEWFLGRVSPRYRDGRPPFIIICRRGWPHEDSWKCAGEAHYVPNFFDAWSPLRAALNAKPEQTEHVDTDVLENSASLNTSKTDGSGE